jgi:hypothetical protein
MSDDKKPAKKSLSEGEVSSRRGIGRRAFLLGTLGGTTALAGCVTATGYTDSDAGRYADPAGAGRGPSGITDADTGRYADPVGRGRGRRACTDADLGAYSDPVGRGRRC